MRSWLLAVTLLSTGGAGFMLGRASAPAPRPVPTPAQHEAVAVTEPARRLPDPELFGAIASLRAEVRALRDELHAKEPAAVASAQAPAAQPPADAEPTPKQQAAYDSARQLITRAQRVGRWTGSDVEQMRRLMPSLSAGETDEIIHTLLPALNSGEIKMETAGPPF